MEPPIHIDSTGCHHVGAVISFTRQSLLRHHGPLYLVQQQSCHAALLLRASAPGSCFSSDTSYAAAELTHSKISCTFGVLTTPIVCGTRSCKETHSYSFRERCERTVLMTP